MIESMKHYEEIIEDKNKTIASLEKMLACKRHEYGSVMLRPYPGHYAEACKLCGYVNEFEKDYT